MVFESASVMVVMTELRFFAPVKINLMLKVTGRRADGYHDLQSLMVPLTVGDKLSIHAGAPPSQAQQAAPLQITCDNPDIPTDKNSLLQRAFRFAANELGYEGSLSIRLDKHIPIGAGLGGGSSDAAAVIRAVEQLTERSIPAASYPELAYQVGADVPFFLNGGACWAEGIGESLRPCSRLPSFHILLVHPGISISTRWVYQNLNVGATGRSHLQESLTTEEAIDTVPPSFETLEQLLPFVTNDLESVVLTHFPLIAEVKRRLSALGADAALMSGSGSAVFGLFSHKNRRDEALEILQAEQPKFWVAGAEILAR